MKLQNLFFTVAYMALSSLTALPPEGDEQEKTSTSVKAVSSMSEQAANPEEKTSLNLIRNIPTEVTLNIILPQVNTLSAYSLRLTNSYFVDLLNDPMFLQHHGRQLFGISLEGIPEGVLSKHRVDPNQLEVFGLPESSSNFQYYYARWFTYSMNVFFQHTYETLLKAVLVSQQEWLGLSTDIYPIKERVDYVKALVKGRYNVEFSPQDVLRVLSPSETRDAYRRVVGSKKENETLGDLVRRMVEGDMIMLPTYMKPSNVI